MYLQLVLDLVLYYSTNKLIPAGKSQCLGSSNTWTEYFFLIFSNAKLDELLSGAPEDSKHLVKSLLLLDPARRLTAKQALNHRYVEK